MSVDNPENAVPRAASNGRASRGGMTLKDLPPADTRRWVARRKADVVAGVRAGLLTLEEACRRYRLTIEEFESWQAMIERHGVRGLRVTRIQQYRDAGRNDERDAGHTSKASPQPAH